MKTTNKNMQRLCLVYGKRDRSGKIQSIVFGQVRDKKKVKVYLSSLIMKAPDHVYVLS
jgi:hypothetical protein